MAYIGKVTAGGTTYQVGSTLYGTCDTAAGTAAKVAVVPGFDTLETGVTVHIKFTYSNTNTSTITLAIKPSSSGTATTAKNIYKYGTTKPGNTAATSWEAGAVVALTYDGTSWMMNDHLDDTNTNNAVTQTESTDDSNQEVLLSISPTTGTDIGGVLKSAGFRYNPSKKSVMEGYNTTASGNNSHAEGNNTIASGTCSHAEGGNTTASGNQSHAEGRYNVASGTCSHAEGNFTVASGNQSHAEGYFTTASHKSQHVFGEYNLADASTAAATARGNYVEIVGNGLSSTQLSNARTLDWDGNEWLAGSLVASSVSAVDSNSNTNTSISPTGLATYTVPSGSQAISTGLYTTSDDIVLYSGTVTNTWDGTNTSLKSAIGRLKYDMDFFTLINAEAVTSTATQKTLYSDRKFSDYSMLVFVAIDNQIRSSITFPSSMFSTLGNPASLTWVDSANTQYWIEVTYVSDTKISVKCKSGVSGKLLYVFGLMKK